MADYHLKAIQFAEAGEWESAHQLIQDYSDRFSCIIHGYLHRVEGDLWNAGYWYNRAGESMPDNSLDEELIRLRNLLDSNAAEC